MAHIRRILANNAANVTGATVNVVLVNASLLASVAVMVNDDVTVPTAVGTALTVRAQTPPPGNTPEVVAHAWAALTENGVPEGSDAPMFSISPLVLFLPSHIRQSAADVGHLSINSAHPASALADPPGGQWDGNKKV